MGEGPHERLSLLSTPHATHTHSRVGTTRAQRQLTRRLAQTHERVVTVGREGIEELATRTRVSVQRDLSQEQCDQLVLGGGGELSLELFEDVGGEGVTHSREEQRERVHQRG